MPPAASAAATPIPQPVRAVPLPPPPEAKAAELKYSVVVANQSVREVLLAMARETKINFDIHPGILHVTSPGTRWTGAERAVIATVALAALDDREPLPPWVTPPSVGRSLPGVDMIAPHVVDAVYRMARHASTLTEDWYRSQIDAGIDPVAYVEIVGVVVAVAAVDGFFRAVGAARPPLPSPVDGAPSGVHPPVEPATLNWVVVAAPADRSAAVVQGLSALPAEFENLERLAAAQYIPMFEMDDQAWNRGTLSRPDWSSSRRGCRPCASASSERRRTR